MVCFNTYTISSLKCIMHIKFLDRIKVTNVNNFSFKFCLCTVLFWNTFVKAILKCLDQTLRKTFKEL